MEEHINLEALSITVTEASFTKCVDALSNAPDHHWTVPRIKSEWSTKLQGVKSIKDFDFVAVPELWIGAET